MADYRAQTLAAQTLADLGLVEADHPDAGLTLEELYARPRPAGYHVPVTAIMAGRRVEVVLSTQHAASSQGLPVVVIGNRAYGPGDLPGAVLRLRPSFAAAARRAGWAVEELPRDPEDEALFGDA